MDNRAIKDKANMTEDSFKDKNILYLWKMIQLPHNAHKSQNKGCFEKKMLTILTFFHFLFKFEISECQCRSIELSHIKLLLNLFTLLGLD